MACVTRFQAHVLWNKSLEPGLVPGGTRVALCHVRKLLQHATDLDIFEVFGLICDAGRSATSVLALPAVLLSS